MQVSSTRAALLLALSMAALVVWALVQRTSALLTLVRDASSDAADVVETRPTTAGPSAAPTLAPTQLQWRHDDCTAASDFHTTAFTRLKQTGLPFVDEYPPINASVSFDANHVFASPGEFERQMSAALSGDPSRHIVYFTWTPHGFGSNLLSHINYIVFAALNNASVVLVSKGSPYMPRRTPVAARDVTFALNETGLAALSEGLLLWWARHQAKQATVQAWYEEAFAYAQCNLTALRYDEVCRGKRDCDFPPFGPVWTGRGRRGDFFKATRWGMRMLRFSAPLSHMFARVQIARALMRMRANSRRQLDAAVVEAAQGVEVKRAVAVHIRRGDKVESGEASATAFDAFVLACFAAGARNASVVFVLSDDAISGPRFAQAWTKLGGSPAMRVVNRTAIFRPDQSIHAVQDARKGFYWLLTDLRLLVQARVFVGTQSSNMGAIVGALRGFHRCFNAENAVAGYAWSLLADKLDR